MFAFSSHLTPVTFFSSFLFNKLHFRKLLDFQNYYEGSTESFCFPHTKFPLLLIYFISMEYLSHLITPNWQIIAN